MYWIHALTIASALLTGCAFSPQQANLQPTVNIISSSEGQGIIVAIRVVDERPSKSLGRRGDGFGAAAEITSSVDLEAIIKDQISSALTARGFIINSTNVASDTQLTVEIRMLQYSTFQNSWTGGVQVQGTLKASASKAGNNYEKMYRYDREESVIIVPTAKMNEEWLNATLSEVLNKLLSDENLIKFLAS